MFGTIPIGVTKWGRIKYRIKKIINLLSQNVELIVFIGIEVAKNNDRSGGRNENNSPDVETLY